MSTDALTITPPRAIDHFVLPVPELSLARARYQALGFTVAPDAVHPFGTENCCIFLADDTFLEPLGIAQRETCEEQAAKGHPFVLNDQTYRFRVSENGFSHLVIKTENAANDHKEFNGTGFSGGRLTRFTRRFKTQDGAVGKVSFRLAFAADKRAPDAGFFACEPVVAAPDKSLLQKHDNGVTGIKTVVMSEPNPTDFQYFLQMFLNQRLVEASSMGMSLAAANADVDVLTPRALEGFYGVKHETGRGLRLQGIVLAVDNLDKTRAHFAAHQIDYVDKGSRLIVPPFEGQGLVLGFEAA